MNANIQFYERVVFGAIIIGGYVLAMGTLAFIPIPKENIQLFTGGIGSLGTALGLIVAAIWKTAPAEAQAQNTIATLADKVQPTPAAGAPGSTTLSVTPPATVNVTTPDPAEELLHAAAGGRLTLLRAALASPP